jgi:hypothetical protein
LRGIAVERVDEDDEELQTRSVAQLVERGLRLALTAAQDTCLIGQLGVQAHRPFGERRGRHQDEQRTGDEGHDQTTQSHLARLRGAGVSQGETRD